jgi:DNA topoisomerase-1
MKEYILRKISKKRGDKYSYVYFDKNGKRANKSTIDKGLDGLYLAPAHDNVKISLNKKDKVLAIGYDVKGRAQYTYNKKFTEKTSKAKYKHMIEFGMSYKKIINQINKDLYTEGDGKNKQIAMILKLVIDCCFRIGNDKYTKENKSYGVSTLLSEHVKVTSDNVKISFKGKKGVENSCDFKDKKLSRELKRKKRTLHKKDRIFTYRNDSCYCHVTSGDVNRYLKRFGNFSTKNFRTWNANIEFITQIVKEGVGDSDTAIKKSINNAVKLVADKLHNTVSVCKSNYIDPILIDKYTRNPIDFNRHFSGCNSKLQYTDKYIELLK